MARYHCQHLQADIDQFLRSTSDVGGQKTLKVDRKGGHKTRDAILLIIAHNAKVNSTQMAESINILRTHGQLRKAC